MSLLKDLAPVLGRLGGDSTNLLAVLDNTASKLRADVARFADQVDPDKCEARLLPRLLRLLGWTFSISLTERQQRGLCKAVLTIYQQKGTKVGIANALRIVLGLNVEVVSFLTDTWELGYSELGVDTYAGAAADSADADKFAVQSPRTLTDQERNAATQIIDFMKPIDTRYVIQEVAA